MDTSFPKKFADHRIAVDIETGPGSDISSVVMTTQMHDEIMFEIKSSDVGATASLQAQLYAQIAKNMAAGGAIDMTSARQIGKMQMHGAAYGIGAQAMGRIKRDKRFYTQSKASARAERVAREHARSIEGLSDDDQRWANAFFEIIKASPDHYARASEGRRKFLREHYTDMAINDRSKRGERAGRILAHVTMHALEPTPAEDDEGDFPHIDALSRSATGRSMSGPVSFQNIPKARKVQYPSKDIAGKTFDTIIVDDVMP